MRLFAATLLAFTVISARAEDDPWAAHKPLVSPAGSFTIVQHRDGDWSTTIRFNRIQAPEVRFTDAYPWPALFYISPDDRWMLQVQKSGSGDNISFLFRIDSEGRLWRMEPGLMQLAWAFVERTESLHRPDLYHTGIGFRSWDLQGHMLHLTFHGTYMHRDAGVHIPLIYDLQKHVITLDKEA